MRFHDMGWGGWIVGCVLMVVFWVGVFWLLVDRFRQPSDRRTMSTAESILAERFARGEISQTQFETARDALRSR